tara:strand:- start:253 stop:1074 length:822 start_codon:yes stop_codon:yes gene_type:complete
MKLTKARLKQIVKEELEGTMERPHRIHMSRDGRVLITKDAAHPSSYAENAPIGLAKLYADLQPGEEEWIDDAYLDQFLDQDDHRYARGAYSDDYLRESKKLTKGKNQMKLTKEKLKRMIKEELTRAKLLSERTIADVAAEQGVGPGEDDGPLDEMATIQQVARDKGVNPDDDAEWKKVISFRQWLDHAILDLRGLGAHNFKLDPDARRSAGGRGSTKKTYYDLSVSIGVAKMIEWPDDLGANWKIKWVAYDKRYLIETDVQSGLGVTARDWSS